MESTTNHSSRRYFCHQCNTTISHTLMDYLCPHCNQGFIEKLSDNPSSASSTYTDQNSENGDEFEHLPMVLDNFLNNISNRVRVMLRHDEGNPENTGDNRPSSSNRRDTSESGRPGNRRLTTYNINPERVPERIISEFFNISRNPQNNNNGPVFLVSNPGDYAWGREGLDTIVTQLLNQMDSSGPPPLTTEKIRELPFVKITEEQISENVQCSVCWDSFQIADNVRQLPCEHIYHDPCIVPWLQLHGTCPICRKLLSEENDSRLGGFAQGASLEALLSDVQRRLSFDNSRHYRRRNIRCFRCCQIGHIARECPIRWNERNRSRRQQNQNSHNNRGWNSSNYEANWRSSNNGNWSPTLGGWGTSSEVWGADTNSEWGNNSSEAWGGSLASRLLGNRGSINSQNTNARDESDTPHFEFSERLSGDDDDDELDFDDEDYTSEPSSIGDDVWTEIVLGGFDHSYRNSNTGFRNQNRRNTRKNGNIQRCYNCNEPGHFARECPSRNHSRSSQSDRTACRSKCDVCWKFGHKTKDCWTIPARPMRSINNVINRPSGSSRSLEHNNDDLNIRSGESRYCEQDDSSNQSAENHADFSAPSTSRSMQQKKSYRRNVICWNCNKSGHMARECTALPNERRKRRFCNVCGSFQHPNGACREIIEF